MFNLRRYVENAKKPVDLRSLSRTQSKREIRILILQIKPAARDQAAVRGFQVCILDVEKSVRGGQVQLAVHRHHAAGRRSGVRGYVCIYGSAGRAKVCAVECETNVTGRLSFERNNSPRLQSDQL